MKKVNNKINLVFVVGLFMIVLSACKKVPDGFLSALVRYEEVPINVPKGRAYVSSALNLDGSQKPVKVKLVHIRDKVTGEILDDVFLKEYPLLVWKGYYDPKLDTTLEMIDAKREQKMVAPVSINESSGQLEANYNTINVPSGSYILDLEISNESGNKIYEGIGEFNILDTPSFEVPAGRSTVAMKVGAESTTKTLPAGLISVKRISEEGNKVIVQIVDKNGVPFNPETGEIARRPQSGTAGGWLQTMQDYALDYQAVNNQMEFTYAVVPFPLASLGNGFNYYYRIPTQFVHFDEELEIPDDTYSCNARFSFRAHQPGTYEVLVTVLGVTHR
ncbi:DUF5007 domain-containing protein [Olivibacter domesticus]|uniref:DUF5007 domain-containing protein n=1 Tax=Olivibacter domesticus TaxID=407022 RepID=A0A1H7TAQ2_OLID1|nr:DUF5007 domain-containing protein [Olivibacter domesticus]SEL81484.1 protein of unknown function [Olivibacter domesticus]